MEITQAEFAEALDQLNEQGHFWTHEGDHGEIACLEDEVDEEPVEFYPAGNISVRAFQLIFARAATNKLFSGLKQ